jgi:hypothetical protein
MSTRSSIWLGEEKGKSVHIYWELADRELGGEGVRAPIYLAVDAGDADKEVKVRLPREIAMRLLMVPLPTGPTRLVGSSTAAPESGEEDYQPADGSRLSRNPPEISVVSENRSAIARAVSMKTGRVCGANIFP